jgi:hypothetical protein
MIFGTYANPKMMAGPGRNFASLVACFKQLEKDFKLLDFKNADDGFIDTFSIGANFGNRVKPAAADVVQRFFPLVAECDNDGGKTLSFFEYCYCAYSKCVLTKLKPLAANLVKLNSAATNYYNICS